MGDLCQVSFIYLNNNGSLDLPRCEQLETYLLLL